MKKIFYKVSVNKKVVLEVEISGTDSLVESFEERSTGTFGLVDRSSDALGSLIKRKVEHKTV